MPPPPALAICRTIADRADRPHVFRARVVFVVLLQEQQDHAVRAERAIDRFDRDRPVDRKRLQRQRKRDRTSEGKDGQFGRKRWMRRLGQGRPQFSW